jgi:hypothetical protein
MSDEHSRASAHHTSEEEERLTKPPPSAVVLSRAERKRSFGRLLESAAEATYTGASLSPVYDSARPITRHVGHLALAGFSHALVPETSRGGILDAATARFFRRAIPEPASDLDPERLFVHAVREEVVSFIWGRFIEPPRRLPPGSPGTDAPPARVKAMLEHAWTQVLRLPRLQQRVLLLSLTLDSITPYFGDERQKARSPRFFVGLALGLYENSVHQHGARIRKKLFPEGTAHLGVDAAEALRCLWTPHVKLARAALTYVEGYREITSRGVPDALQDTCAAYEARLRTSREASAQARQAFREVVSALDASGTGPEAVHAALVEQCKSLGIDDRVRKRARPSAGGAGGAGNRAAPARRWADLLPDGESCRPTGTRRVAWRRFLQRHLPAATEAHARFEDFEARSRAADAAREAKLGASQALFDAATESDTTSTITRLLDLISEAQATLDRG